LSDVTTENLGPHFHFKVGEDANNISDHCAGYKIKNMVRLKGPLSNGIENFLPDLRINQKVMMSNSGEAPIEYVFLGSDRDRWIGSTWSRFSRDGDDVVSVRNREIVSVAVA
jgi:hypothetical protein